jgi:hypothetical protein
VSAAGIGSRRASANCNTGATIRFVGACAGGTALGKGARAESHQQRQDEDLNSCFHVEGFWGYIVKIDYQLLKSTCNKLQFFIAVHL